MTTTRPRPPLPCIGGPLHATKHDDVGETFTTEIDGARWTYERGPERDGEKAGSYRCIGKAP